MGDALVIISLLYQDGIFESTSSERAVCDNDMQKDKGKIRMKST